MARKGKKVPILEVQNTNEDSGEKIGESNAHLAFQQSYPERSYLRGVRIADWILRFQLLSASLWTLISPT